MVESAEHSIFNVNFISPENYEMGFKFFSINQLENQIYRGKIEKSVEHKNLMASLQSHFQIKQLETEHPVHILGVAPKSRLAQKYAIIKKSTIFTRSL